MIVRETDRLVLRQLTLDDAAFILELVNEPSWLQFIGDKGVRTIEDARYYISSGPLAMYLRLGFGLYLVELKTETVPIGICGPVKRDGLDDVDIGFAFLQRFGGSGYAYEAAAAIVAHAKEDCGLKRLVAIAAPTNRPSIRLLEKLGLGFERMIRLAADRPESGLYAREL
jgi:RimJ/RimL family protein N-acetyltransferase